MSDPVLPSMQAMAGAKDKPKDDGIPLQVIASGQGKLVLQDSDGVAFEVPESWLPGVVPEDAPTVSHLDIKAPAGQLADIWRRATAAMGMDVEREEPVSDDEANEATSLYDKYQAGEYDKNGSTDRPAPAMGGDIVLGDTGQGGTGYQPPIPTYAGHVPPTPAMIPGNAVSGWGNWNDKWDPIKKKWVKVQ